MAPLLHHSQSKERAEKAAGRDMSVLEPLDPPPDRYGLNREWPDFGDVVFMVLAAIPVLGLGTPIGAYIWYRDNREDNPYNLAETSRKTFLASMAVQTVSTLTVAVILVVVL